MDKKTRLCKKLHVHTTYNEQLCHTSYQFLTIKTHSLLSDEYSFQPDTANYLRKILYRLTTITKNYAL